MGVGTDDRPSVDSALIALAVAARAAAVLVLQSHTVPHSTYEHGEIAANLLAGRGFSVKFLGGRRADLAAGPALSVLVAAAYAVGGVGTPGALLILELGQAVLGGLLVAGMSLRLTREVAPGRPMWGLAAGLIAAVHPTLVYAATHVQVALLAATLLAWTLRRAYRAGRTGRDRDATVAGVWLALLALTDPILAWPRRGWPGPSRSGRGWRGSIRPAAVVAIVAAWGSSPWIARNYRVHGEFVRDQEHVRLRLLAGELRPERGDRQGRPGVGRDGPGGARHGPPRAERGPLGGPARGGLPRRHRLDPGRLPDARPALRAGAVAASSSAGPWPTSGRAGPLSAALPAPAPLLRPLRRDQPEDAEPRLPRRPPGADGPGRCARAARDAGRDCGGGWGRPSLTAALIAAFHALTIVSARFHIPIEPLMGLWAAGRLDVAGRPDQPRRPTTSKASGSWIGSLPSDAARPGRSPDSSAGGAEGCFKASAVPQSTAVNADHAGSLPGPGLLRGVGEQGRQEGHQERRDRHAHPQRHGGARELVRGGLGRRRAGSGPVPGPSSAPRAPARVVSFLRASETVAAVNAMVEPTTNRPPTTVKPTANGTLSRLVLDRDLREDAEGAHHPRRVHHSPPSAETEPGERRGDGSTADDVERVGVVGRLGVILAQSGGGSARVPARRNDARRGWSRR